MVLDFTARLHETLAESCKKCQSHLLSLSGGLDSTILAYHVKKSGSTGLAVISEDFTSPDLTYSQMASKEMGWPLVILDVPTVDILRGVEQTIKILKNFNDIEIRNSVVMYLAIKWAKDHGHDSIITGDGADELFAGYNFMLYKPHSEIKSEIDRVCSTMHFPAQDIGRALGVAVESPFLDPQVTELAASIPADLKVRDHNNQRYGKWILREAFEGHIPRQIAWRPKSAMQDGSGTAGLTGLFDSVIDEEAYVEKKLLTEKNDRVIIRSRESMHYYEIYTKLFGSPASKDARHPCPYCRHDAGSLKFCRMCGAYPV